MFLQKCQLNFGARTDQVISILNSLIPSHHLADRFGTMGLIPLDLSWWVNVFNFFIIFLHCSFLLDVTVRNSNLEMFFLCFGVCQFFELFCTAQCIIQLTKPWKNYILLIIKGEMRHNQKCLRSSSTVILSKKGRIYIYIFYPLHFALHFILMFQLQV